MTQDEEPADAGDGAGSVSTATTAWAEEVRATYDHVRAPLWRALVAWSASPDVADEAVAEAFAQLLRRGSEVRDPAAWVWRAAFRLAAGDLKRRRLAAGAGGRNDDALARLAAAPDRLPDDALDLVRALASLSEQQRRCVALVDVAGHTAPSAAAVLGTSAATVRVQLMRARRRLRTLVADPAESATGATTSGHPDRTEAGGVGGTSRIRSGPDQTAIHNERTEPAASAPKSAPSPTGDDHPEVNR